MLVNIITSPLDQKFRRVPKSSKSLQEKVLPYKNAMKFLFVAGFLEDNEAIYMDGFDHHRTGDANRALEHFVESMGAKVAVNSAFDPYKASVSSTNAMSTKDV